MLVISFSKLLVLVRTSFLTTLRCALIPRSASDLSLFISTQPKYVRPSRPSAGEPARSHDDAAFRRASLPRTRLRRGELREILSPYRPRTTGQASVARGITPAICVVDGTGRAHPRHS